jgi:hypothetical protein
MLSGPNQPSHSLTWIQNMGHICGTSEQTSTKASLICHRGFRVSLSATPAVRSGNDLINWTTFCEMAACMAAADRFRNEHVNMISGTKPHWASASSKRSCCPRYIPMLKWPSLSHRFVRSGEHSEPQMMRRNLR